jgi:hypothetical protein
MHDGMGTDFAKETRGPWSGLARHCTAQLAAYIMKQLASSFLIYNFSFLLPMIHHACTVAHYLFLKIPCLNDAVAV